MRSDLLHIAPYDIASIATLFIGLTIASLLGVAKRPARSANIFLSLALAVIVLKAAALTSLFLLALGPLLYLYVRQLTNPEQRFGRKDILHFCPLIAAFAFPVWLVLISVIIYLSLSYRLIQSFYDSLKPVLMDRPRFAFRRLERVLLLLGLLFLLAIYNDLFCFAIAYLLITLAITQIIDPERNIQITVSTTNITDEREKARRLKEGIAAGRLYEDAELTLATLALKLYIHPHELSRIINVGLKKNFNDLINELRVREVCRKMRDPAYDHLNLLGIAYGSGFNSKTTFNRVFREITGKTPLEYKKRCRFISWDAGRVWVR